MNQIRGSKQLQIGALIFPGVDQIDFTGPFEIFSRLPGATYHIIAKDKKPIRDRRGLILTPEKTYSEISRLDLLHVPGGPGQEALMDDEETLSFIREQAANANYIFSVCTGALILGAAGLLVGKRATTHWAAFHLLNYFGATPTNERVVFDGKLVSAAGVTAGIDGALRVAALLYGERKAQEIQLDIQYAPEPPFNSGSVNTAPKEVVQTVRAAYQSLTDARLVTARRIKAKLGIEYNTVTAAD
ncbi:MAG: DJ-1/PfpI family protein [Verrucomicrobia bacterium]|nr:DJ-1/PfpI family protein [Verrucomicrobiota bacterium]